MGKRYPKLLPAGFLNLHKPPGMVTRRLVDKLQHIYGVKTGIGFSGTLDPFASGVVPVALGRANRFLPYFSSDKEYVAVFKFGVSTATDDFEGALKEVKPQKYLDFAATEQALQRFTGTIQQVPHATSALKLASKRAYALVQRHGTAHVEQLIRAKQLERTVHVESIRPDGWCSNPECDFPELTATVSCGTGTFIRSMARDMASVPLPRAAAGSEQAIAAEPAPAVLASLLRTVSNGFSLSDALPVASLHTTQDVEAALLPCDAPLLHLPAVVLGRREIRGLPGLVEEAGPGRPAASAMLLDDPKALLQVLIRWAHKGPLPHPPWAIATPELGSPLASRGRARQDMAQACAGASLGAQQGGIAGGWAGAATGMVRAYVLATVRALTLCKVPMASVRSALPEASLLDIVGHDLVEASRSGSPKAPVLCFLGVGRVHNVERALGPGGHSIKMSTLQQQALAHKEGQGQGAPLSTASSTPLEVEAAELTVEGAVSTLEIPPEFRDSLDSSPRRRPRA